MVFSSLIFVFLFLPVTVIGYYVVGKRFQNIALLTASLFFYAWGEPIYLFLMILSIWVNYSIGLLLDRMKRRKAILIAGLTFNIGLLCFFKYAGMLVETAWALAGITLTVVTPPLPLGISFYTFQAISYLIDVYRLDVTVQKSFLRFGVYISMFAQLVAGPIVNYKDIDGQLEKRKFDGTQFVEGVQRFLLGLGKKVLLANNLGRLWDNVKSTPPGELSSFPAWLGLIAFTLQIYFDFDGYSDMAIGLGKMFGFNFPENFRCPYLSANVSDFWRRWHISLGAWFRSYVYIPLGGSRVSKVRLVRNLLIVWLLTGLWHGASWNFVLWGFYYGIILITEKIWLGSWMQKWPGILCHSYTLLAVMLGWVIFEFSSFSEGLYFLRSMFFVPTSGKFMLVHDFFPLIFIGMIIATPLPQKLLAILMKKFSRTYLILTTICYAGVTILSTACLVGSTYNPFLYFRF